jgi:hypothetical protein
MYKIGSGIVVDSRESMVNGPLSVSINCSYVASSRHVALWLPVSVATN